MQEVLTLADLQEGWMLKQVLKILKKKFVYLESFKFCKMWFHKMTKDTIFKEQ